MKNPLHSWLLTCAVSLLSAPAHASIHPAHIFGDHMVLQRDIPLKVWGWADAGEKVTVAFHSQKKRATTDAEGRWEVVLDRERAGGPYTLTLAGKDTVTFADVLVGEVWICSGQSNMEWILADAANGAAEVAAANYPEIRHIDIPNRTSLLPEKDIEKTPWQVCTPEVAGEFSAVAYFYARKLYQETKIPVGLVNATWGGTICETWLCRAALENHPDFQPVAATLPQSIEDFKRQLQQKSLQRIEKFQGMTPVHETSMGWESADWADSGWVHLQAPLAWEEQGLPDFDGVVWYRKTINLTEWQARQPAILYLGMIDDCDSTYLNGQKIGITCNWNTPRKYPIPAGLLKPGRNVIAVKAIDWGGGGGIYGEPDAVKLMLGPDSLSLAGAWKARVDPQAVETALGPNTLPTLLFNGMIHPLIRFGIKGAIWYQGESNVARAAQYATAFPLMITDWRRQWQQGDFPFYFVQLASYLPLDKNSLVGSEWAELRNAQLQTLSLPHTGMAVTIDIGDEKDIHPRNKQDVGLRLALHALKNDYGKQVENYGPMYRSMAVKGREIEITFDHVGSGLVALNKYGYVFGFSIAGADQQFHWSTAAYIKGDKIMVYSDNVPNPVAVRYGWVDNPEGSNLFNNDGLPASPFRTDNWKLVTEGRRY